MKLLENKKEITHRYTVNYPASCFEMKDIIHTIKICGLTIYSYKQENVLADLE